MNPTLELPVSELKTAFAGLSKIINSKPALPVLGCIRVESRSDGTVNLDRKSVV